MTASPCRGALRGGRCPTVILPLLVAAASGLAWTGTSCAGVRERPGSGPAPVSRPPGRSVPAGRPRLLDCGPAIRRGMLDLVRGARESILIVSYLVTRSDPSAEVLDALKAAHRRGVRVHVIADSSSRFVGARPAFRELRDAGVPCAEFHPIGPLSFLRVGRLLERDHRKFWVVDGRTILIGGANLDGESLAEPGLGGNLDLMVRFDSPAAARELTRSFVETWNHSSRAKLRAADFASAPALRAPGAVWLFDQPLGGRAPVVPSVFDWLFAAARREIWLLHSYAFTDPTLLRRIRAARARGVKVNLVLTRKARAPRFLFASYYGIRDALEAGAAVWISGSHVSALHYKAALVDERWVCVGSANLNRRSYGLSREAVAVFCDPTLAAATRRLADRALAGGHAVSAGEAARYRSPVHWFWWSLLQVGG